jgi:hypothetical protein
VTGTSFDPRAFDAALFAKFIASSDTGDCGCVSPSTIWTLESTELSAGNDYFYCASPSGALLRVVGIRVVRRSGGVARPST